jgi:hypothetical protein
VFEWKDDACLARVRTLCSNPRSDWVENLVEMQGELNLLKYCHPVPAA